MNGSFTMTGNVIIYTDLPVSLLSLDSNLLILQVNGILTSESHSFSPNELIQDPKF